MEAEELPTRLTETLPESLASKLRWLQTIVRNNSMSADVLAPQGWDAQDIADMNKVQLAKNPIDIMDKKVRAECARRWRPTARRRTRPPT